jgi:magnesium chelatase subunit I
VGRELIREAVGEVFSVYLGAADLRPVVSYFEAGGSLKLREDAPSQELLDQLRRVPGLMDHIRAVGVAASDEPPLQLAAAEFILEGLWAQRKIGRSDERVYSAPERREESDVDRMERLRRMKKQVN